MKFKRLLLLIVFGLMFLQTNASINLNVGETYTCDLGYIQYFKECVWTSSDYQCLDFVGTVTNHSTKVTVKALAKPSYVTPVTIHCQYYYYDLDPTTGRYTYLRSGYKDFQFFIKANGSGGVTVSPENIELEPGSTYTLNAQVSGNLSIEWSSSDNSVASVNNVGKVTAKSEGKTVITATASNGEKGYCNVIVKSSYVKVIDISLDIHSLTMNLGDTYQLNASVLPSNATDKKITWSSDNTNIATVSNSGLVKATGKGETYVNCKTNDGGYETFCKITVNDKESGISKWNVKQISTWSNHTMILLSDGKLMACGNNRWGQLGDGTTTNRAVPVKVMDDVSAVSAGDSYTMIIKKDGTLWGCGRNSDGELGDGTRTDKSTPVKIMSNVAEVITGSSSTMIVKTDGSLWACGYNDYGQLCDGTTTKKYSPVKVMTDVKMVSIGYLHSMIVKNDGSLWACGLNNRGQLCDGTTTNKTSPTKVMKGVAAVYTGMRNTFLLKDDGSLWACGENDKGQLGDGTTLDKQTLIKLSELGESSSVKVIINYNESGSTIHNLYGYKLKMPQKGINIINGKKIMIK